jgi:16S rRNA C967 or C1407 C5-methylase (RsmB/RsmF family)
MLAKAGCSNVIAMNADFLATDPTDEQFANVSHILLDPSCSGSGIINRLDYLFETGKLASLSYYFSSTLFKQKTITRLMLKKMHGSQSWLLSSSS